MIEETDVRAVESVERHPAVRQVCLTGSRASGTATPLSDWDFLVDTDDFPALAHDIGSLVERLHPPAANPNWTAVFWLVALGVMAAAVGAFAFNQRDLASA